MKVFWKMWVWSAAAAGSATMAAVSAESDVAADSSDSAFAARQRRLGWPPEEEGMVQTTLY